MLRIVTTFIGFVKSQRKDVRVIHRRALLPIIAADPPPLRLRRGKHGCRYRSDSDWQ